MQNSRRRLLELSFVLAVVAVLAVFLRPQPTSPHDQDAALQAEAQARVRDFFEESRVKLDKAPKAIALHFKRNSQNAAFRTMLISTRMLNRISELEELEAEIEALERQAPSPERERKLEELSAREAQLEAAVDEDIDKLLEDYREEPDFP